MYVRIQEVLENAREESGKSRTRPTPAKHEEDCGISSTRPTLAKHEDYRRYGWRTRRNSEKHSIRIKLVAMVLVQYIQCSEFQINLVNINASRHVSYSMKAWVLHIQIFVQKFIRR